MKTQLRINRPDRADELGAAESLLRLGLTAALAVLAANARLIGGVAGMGAALSAALPKRYACAAVAGSFVGYWIFAGQADRAVLFPALFLLLALKLFFRPVSSAEASPLLLGFTSFGTLLLCGIGASAIGRADLLTWFMRGMQALLCFAVTYFCAVAVRAFLSGRERRFYTGQEAVSVGIVAAVFLIALCGVGVFTVSLGRVAGVFAALWFLDKGGYRCAAVAAGAGAALMLYSLDFAPYCGALTAAAVFGSALRPFGRVGRVACFLAVNTCGALLIGVNAATYAYLIDAGLAAAVFLLVPARVAGRPLPFLAGGEEAAGAGERAMERGWLVERLRFASESVRELGNSVELVSRRMHARVPLRPETLFYRSADQVCRRCGLRPFCWGTETAAQRELGPAGEILRREGALSEEQMPRFLKEHCVKLPALTAAVNRGCRAELSGRQAARVAEEVRAASSEQFDGVAELLRGIGEEFDAVAAVDPEGTKKVLSVLRSLNVGADRAVCYADREGKTGVELYLSAPLPVSEETLCDAFSAALERPFDLPSAAQAGGRTRLSFFETARYRAAVHVEQIPADGEQRCGDSCETLLDAGGFFYLILSDGMGSGGPAAVGSAMTCAFLLRLLRAGFGLAPALRLVNSALLAGAPAESFATLDVLRLDLCTGQAELYKAGAAPSFFLRGKNVLRRETDSLPVGILKEARLDRRSVRLSAGDVILMVSDGATAAGNEWIEEELARLGKAPAREIAERIAGEARRRRNDGHSDDVTVVAVRLSEG